MSRKEFYFKRNYSGEV